MALMKRCRLVQQEPILFDGTIAENIAFGLRGATKDKIMDAAIKANAHDFIMNFPNGYTTRVGEGGSQLSGGQKQRIGGCINGVTIDYKLFAFKSFCKNYYIFSNSPGDIKGL